MSWCVAANLPPEAPRSAADNHDDLWGLSCCEVAILQVRTVLESEAALLFLLLDFVVIGVLP